MQSQILQSRYPNYLSKIRTVTKLLIKLDKQKITEYNPIFRHIKKGSKKLKRKS